MRLLMPLALVAIVLTGCASAASPPDASAESDAPAGDALVGSYSVEYRTTESDHDAITDETVTRDAEVTGSCSGSDCDLTYTVELKAADGSTTSGTTALTFDGATYHGTQTSTYSCDGLTTLTTVEDGLEYTSETTITPSSTTVEDDRDVVATFDIVTVERNEITAAGRDAGCLSINLSGPDPYVASATTVGVGTRQP